MKYVDRRTIRQCVGLYANILLSWRSIVTCGLSLLGIAVYYVASWDTVELFIARCVGIALKVAGYAPSRNGNCIVLDGVALCIEEECTHICLILAGLPFVWRGGQITRDVLRVLFFVIAIQAGNIARIYWTIVLSSEGVVWKYAHDLVAHLFRDPIDILILVLWMGAMRRSFDQTKPVEDSGGNYVSSRKPRGGKFWM